MIEQLSETGERLAHRNQRVICEVERGLLKLERNLEKLKKLKADGQWGKPWMDWSGRLSFVEWKLEDQVTPALGRLKGLVQELLQDLPPAQNATRSQSSA